MPGSQVTSRVRLIFIAAIAVLAAQSVFINRYGEPYPAIMMPGFEGSGGYQEGQVKIVRFEAVFVADGEEFSFQPKVLLNEFPISHHGAISESSLKPRLPSPPAAPPSRLGSLRDALFPGYAGRRMSRVSPETAASLRNWLQSRGRDLVPGRQVSRVEIRWFRETVQFATGQFAGDWRETAREPIYTVVVTLAEEPG